jgi:hypothetical protein
MAFPFGDFEVPSRGDKDKAIADNAIHRIIAHAKPRMTTPRKASQCLMKVVLQLDTPQPNRKPSPRCMADCAL